MSGVRDEVRALATKLLERRGGLVDWPSAAETGTAVVPPEVAAALPTHEEVVPLSTEPGGPGLCVNLTTDFLDVAGRLLEAEPRIGAFRLPGLHLKGRQIEEAVGRAFAWLNAKVKIHDIRSDSIEYHTWWFHASLASEDRWESRFAVSINASSGAEIPMPDPLELWELEPGHVEGRAPASTYDRAAAVARGRLESAAAEFIGRMEGRLQRDRKRLREYYHALLREADAKKARPNVKATPEEIEAKKRAVELELRRKLGELDERYAMQATLRPIVLLRTEVPVLAVDLAVFRKRAHRKHTVYWNPLLKQFEPLLCSRCHSATFVMAFTDEDVAPLCSPCWGKGTGE